jgi:hypothetical protein
MAISAEVRAAVRTAFEGRCGYCGISETFVGGALEMDHHIPQAAAPAASERMRGERFGGGGPQGARRS